LEGNPGGEGITLCRGSGIRQREILRLVVMLGGYPYL
jgi:hypothetical protein